jgi:hypothetical protein
VAGVIGNFRRNPTDESNVAVGKGGSISAYGVVRLKPDQLIELGSLLITIALDLKKEEGTND